jgi:hypothetical protein
VNVDPALCYQNPVNLGNVADISEDFIPEDVGSMYLKNFGNAVKFHSVQISRSRIDIFKNYISIKPLVLSLTLVSA